MKSNQKSRNSSLILRSNRESYSEIRSKVNSGELSRKKKQEILTENLLKRSKLDKLTVVGLKIDLLRPNVLKGLSVANVTNVVSDETGGINDPKSGVTSDFSLCKSCGEINYRCVGHMMSIPLPTGVKFIPAIFLEIVVRILRCTCFNCSGIMVTDLYLRTTNKGNIMEYKGTERLKEIAEECTTAQSSPLMCPRDSTIMPGVLSPLVKKDFKVNTCRKNRKYVINNGIIQSINPEKKVSKKKSWSNMHDRDDAPDTIDINAIYDVLKYISEADKILMGFPKDFVLTDFICDTIPCIPPNTRPQNFYAGETRADPLSNDYDRIVKKILEYNTITKNDKNFGTKNDCVTEIINTYNSMVDNSDEKVKQGASKNFDGVKQKIGTKKGLIRNNCMGKTVGFCCRTVVGPDSNLRYGEIGLPLIVRSELTVKETVTAQNEELFKSYLSKGEIKTIKFGSMRKKSYIGNSVLVSKNKDIELSIGDTVSRYSRNGDICIFGRQPTLHKEGLQGYRIQFTPGYTSRLHICSTKPHNADFDGDEMTAYMLQTVGARVEGAYLANAESCIQDSQKSKTMVGLAYNALSSIYIMTQTNRDKVILTEEEFEEAENVLTFTDDIKTVEKRINKHNKKLGDTEHIEYVDPLSGKALFSRLLPADFNYDGKETKKSLRELDEDNKVVVTENVDVTVKIRNGVLVKGIITSEHIGSAHNSIVHVLWKNYGKVRTAAFLTDGTFLADWFIFNYGFSIGINDFISENQDQINKTVDDEINNTYESIYTLGEEKKNITPAEKNYREQQIQGFTNSNSNIGKLIAKNNLLTNNSLNIMADSGAKGNSVNTAQICGLVGQQFTRRNRPIPNLDNKTRCLPYFAKNSKLLEARGMIRTSFFTGINPAGAFFHMIGTRENIVQTASATPEVGALHRRLCKVLESTHVAYDGSVRNCTGVAFQYICADGFDAGQSVSTRTSELGSILSFIDIEDTVKNLNINIEIALKKEKKAAKKSKKTPAKKKKKV
jgi:DNA-directed RNA polymerase beta' subunit